MAATAQELQARLDVAEKKLADIHANPAPTPDVVTKGGTIAELKSAAFGTPTIRKGESVLSSRGWRLGRALQAMQLKDWSHAKVEKGLHDMLARAFGGGCGSATFGPETMLAPFGTRLMPDDMANDSDFGVKIKSLFHAGVEDADIDEMRWLATKAYEGGVRKDMSWLDSSAGGAIVGPAERGEFVDLLRNTSALAEAGCRIIPMPPNGRIQFPKQTSATTGYWVGESAAITASQPGTGLITLSAKKCAGLTKIPNELIRYAGAAAEALVRMDLTKTLQLTFDLAGIEGTGGDTKPLGIINTPGIQSVTATTAATGETGNILASGDIYKFMQQTEESNAQFEGFLLAPRMYYAFQMRRNAAYNTADGEGAFTFFPLRALGDAVNQKNIAGYKATTSNQVSKTRTQGSTSNKTLIIGGMFSDVMLAMFGAMEFALGTQGDTPFVYDQTWVRAIMIGDVGIRHPGALSWIDKVEVV